MHLRFDILHRLSAAVDMLISQARVLKTDDHAGALHMMTMTWPPEAYLRTLLALRKQRTHVA